MTVNIFLLATLLGLSLGKLHHADLNAVEKTPQTDVTGILEYLQELARDLQEVKGQVGEVKDEVRHVRKQGDDVMNLLNTWDDVILEEEGEEGKRRGHNV